MSSLTYIFNFFFYYFRLFLLGVATAPSCNPGGRVWWGRLIVSPGLSFLPWIDLMTFREVRPLPLFKHWPLLKLNVGREETPGPNVNSASPISLIKNTDLTTDDLDLDLDLDLALTLPGTVTSPPALALTHVSCVRAATSARLNPLLSQIHTGCTHRAKCVHPSFQKPF